MNQIIYIDVNFEVLIWAREAIALTRTNASENSGIPLRKLTQLEDGSILPTIEELKELSKTYKRTIATLLLKEPPLEKPLPTDRRTVDSKDIGYFHEKTIMAIRKARALVSSLIELKQEAGITIQRFQYKATLSQSASEMAIQLRREWNLEEIRDIKNINAALDAYIDKVEGLGIAVFQLSLTQDKLRGFSIVDDLVPIVGIKRGGETPTAKIFTLFHEVGHVLLNEGGLCDLSENNTQQIEKWCNAFAAEILIPTAELLQMKFIIDKKIEGNKIWLKKDLLEISNYFHVGPLAILRSLLENNLTTKAYYQEKHVAWNKPSFGRPKTPEGRNIPKETIKEKGRTYISLAFSAFDKNRIDLKDLSDFLGIKLSYIPKTRQLLNA